jgi:Transposase DDE domain
LNATVQVVKRNGLHTFAVIPKGWVVERSFAWLEKNRRLWKNCERRLNTSLQFVHLAFSSYFSKDREQALSDKRFNSDKTKTLRVRLDETAFGCFMMGPSAPPMLRPLWCSVPKGLVS